MTMLYYLVIERSTGRVFRSVQRSSPAFSTESTLFILADSVLLHRYEDALEAGNATPHLNELIPNYI